MIFRGAFASRVSRIYGSIRHAFQVIVKIRKPSGGTQLTLVVGMGNDEYMLQVSDRRLLAGETPVDEESCKGGIFLCKNARLAFGFTGIAKVGGLIVRRWILDGLMESGPPTFDAKGILDRFTERATHAFSSVNQFRSLRPDERRLTILFSGYLYQHSPPLAAYCFVSNYQNFQNGIDSPTALPSFSVFYSSEKRPSAGSLSMVQRIGAIHLMPPEEVPAFRTMLEEHKPAKALIGKLLEYFDSKAEGMGGKGAVGTQVSWVVVPRDLQQAVQTGYGSGVNTSRIWIPSYANIDSHGSYVLDDVSVQPVDPEITPPMAVRKVPKGAPCPCGSQKKYKHCHGRHH